MAVLLRRLPLVLLVPLLAVMFMGATGTEPDLPRGKIDYPVESGPTTSDADTAYGGDVRCSIYASDPSQTGFDINGNGWQYCFGSDFVEQKLTVKLQRHRWWGWQTLASSGTGWRPNHWLAESVYTTCRTGTYTYRVVSQGWVRAFNGEVHYGEVQSGNYLRVTC